MLGSIFATWAFNKIQPKYVLSTCLFLNIWTLFLFTLTKKYFLLIICRILTGVFQVCMCIFFPVWADIYGSKMRSSKWLGYLLIASPCGVVVGYGICAIMLETIGWRYAFYFQICLMIPCLIGMIITPSRYMDFNMVATKIKLHELSCVKKNP